MAVWRGWGAVGYGRNRSTANALSCLAPGEAPSPSPSITRRWTRPLARPGSQAESRLYEKALIVYGTAFGEFASCSTIRFTSAVGCWRRDK